MSSLILLNVFEKHEIPAVSTNWIPKLFSRTWIHAKALYVNQYTTFNDPVHGSIILHPLLVKIIDTPEFQRLRNIKQLGAGYYVYPEGQHNRFEHSIGTAHLAGKLVRHLKKSLQEEELLKNGQIKESAEADTGTKELIPQISGKDVLCVEIAALCHDLGHGPFSHLFDGMFVPRVNKNIHWEHEKKSCDMFDDIIKGIKNDEVYLESGLEAQDLDFVKEMIDGPLEKGGKYVGRPEKEFLYEIISNKDSGVDVDKWDYLARDCYHLGIPNGFDHNRFIKFTKVVEAGGKRRICARDKEGFDLYQMFHTRFTLHKRACQHVVVNAYEHMICDAMFEADKYIKIPKENGATESISDCLKDEHKDAFLNLDDGVLQTILHSSCESARNIVKRILRRDHYRCVDDRRLSKSQQLLNEEEIAREIADKDPTLTENDIAISVVKFSYGKKERDPVDYYWFYSKNDPNKAKKISKEEVSIMLPEIFEERRIQIFSKKAKNNEKVKEAFEKWYVKPEPTASTVLRELKDTASTLKDSVQDLREWIGHPKK